MTDSLHAAASNTGHRAGVNSGGGSGSGGDVINSRRHITAEQIRPINALTRLCSEPGRLQYNEYTQYLQDLGHIKGDMSNSTTRRDSETDLAEPLISNLQRKTANHDDNDDMTDWRAEQAFWHLDDLPDLLYVFEKPDWWLDRTGFKEPPKKPYPIYGKVLRDIPILPDHISSAVEGWRIETWMRMDARVSYPDIYDRIHPDTRPKHHSTVQMRVERFRHGKDDRTEGFKSVGWISGKNQAANIQSVRDDLVAAGIDLHTNSTRGLSWGLVDRVKGEEYGRVAVPESVRRALKSTVNEARIDLRPIDESWRPSGPQMFQQNQGQVSHRAPQASHGLATTQLIRSPLVVPIFQVNLPVLNQLTQASARTGSEIISGSQQNTTRTLPFRPRPALNTPAEPIRIQSGGRVLTLKTKAERMNLSQEDRELLSTWFPGGSEGRYRQLEFVLDPKRAPLGFVDNHGYYPSIGYRSERGGTNGESDDEVDAFQGMDKVNCTDVDIIYSVQR